MPNRRVNVKITGDASNYQAALAKMAASTEAAEKRLEDSSKRVETAKRREQTATDQVRIASMRLKEAQDKEGTSTSTLETRVLALARAQERLKTRTSETVTATEKLKKAQTDLDKQLSGTGGAGAPGSFRKTFDVVEREAGAAGGRSGRTFAKQFGVEFRQRSVFIAGVVGAALTAGAPVALAGAAMLFGGIAAYAGAQSLEVKKAWLDLGHEVKNSLVQDSQAMIPALTDMAADLGKAFHDLGPQLTSAFEATAPLVQSFTDGIIGLATHAMPGLVEAVESAGPVMEGFQKFLERFGDGLGGMFSEMSEAAPAAGDAFAAWGDIFGELLPLIGELLDIGSQLARVVLPPLAGALWGVHGVLELIGPLIPGIAAGFIAFKAAGLASAGLRRMSDGLAAVAQRAAEATYNTEGFTRTAATGASNSASRVGKAFGGMADNVGKAAVSLPALGFVLAGISSDISDASSQEDAWAQAILQGGNAASAAYKNYKGNTHWGQAIDEAAGLAASWDDAKAKADKLREEMSPLGRAQLDVAIATGNLQAVISNFGIASDEAASAAGTLTREQERLAEEQASLEVAAAIGSGAIRALGDVTGYSNTQIAEALKKNDEWRTSLSETVASFVEPMDTYKRLLDDKTTAEQEQAQNTADKTKSMSDSWHDYMGEVHVTFEEYMTALQEQVDAQNNWQTNMLILAGRVSQGTLDELARMGPEGAPLVADLVTKSDAELARMEGLFREKSKNATDAWALEMQLAAPILAEVAKKAGQGVANGLAEKLAAGTITVAQIARQYGINIANGVNPILQGLGKPLIVDSWGTIRPQGFIGPVQADGSVLDFFARGGMRESHVAQIAPAGAWRVWAEPETGGEAYIPLSPSKRSRSLDIWQETGRRLQAFAGGGFTSTASVPRPSSTAPFRYPINYPADSGMARIYSEAVSWLQASLAPVIASTAAGSVASAPAAAGGNVGLVRAMAAARGWTGAQWNALYTLIMHESGFRNTAQNPTSTAYGMFQFLNSTWGSTGYGKTSDPRIQTLAGFQYIASRYGSPIGAWNFWSGHHWYADGGVVNEPVFGVGLRSGQTYSFAENGPEIVMPASREYASASHGGGGGTTSITLDGARITGRLALDHDGFARLIDGRIEIDKKMAQISARRRGRPR